MSISKKYVDRRIIEAPNADSALVEVIDMVIRFNKKIRTDYSNMSNQELSNSNRSREIVEYANYRLADLSEFRKINFKNPKSISGKSIMMAIDLKHKTRGTEFTRF